MYSYEIDNLISCNNSYLSQNEFSKVISSSPQITHISRLYEKDNCTVYEFGTSDNYNWEVTVPNVRWEL